MVPAGTDMPTVATAAAGIVSADAIAGADNFAAKVALAALGVATPHPRGGHGVPHRGVGRHADDVGAVTAILAVNAETTDRRKKAKEVDAKYHRRCAVRWLAC